MPRLEAAAAFDTARPRLRTLSCSPRLHRQPVPTHTQLFVPQLTCSPTQAAGMRSTGGAVASLRRRLSSSCATEASRGAARAEGRRRRQEARFARRPRGWWTVPQRRAAPRRVTLTTRPACALTRAPLGGRAEIVRPMSDSDDMYKKAKGERRQKVRGARPSRRSVSATEEVGCRSGGETAEGGVRRSGAGRCARKSSHAAAGVSAFASRETGESWNAVSKTIHHATDRSANRTRYTQLQQ